MKKDKVTALATQAVQDRAAHDRIVSAAIIVALAILASILATPAFAQMDSTGGSLPAPGILSLAAAVVVGAIFLARRKR